MPRPSVTLWFGLCLGLFFGSFAAVAAPRVAQKLHAVFPGLPVIGGGLIEGVREMEDLLKAGLRSVSVSDPRLWLI